MVVWSKAELRQQVMFGLMLKGWVGQLIGLSVVGVSLCVCYWQEGQSLTEGLRRARSSSLCADRQLAPESQHKLWRHTPSTPSPDPGVGVFITAMAGQHSSKVLIKFI